MDGSQTRGRAAEELSETGLAIDYFYSATPEWRAPARLFGQQLPACTGGQGSEPYEQNTQQSPARGLSRVPQSLQS